MIRPMLACKLNDPNKIFPKEYFISPKLNGIRFMLQEKVLYSRTGKPIPNRILQAHMRELNLYPDIILDGELIVGKATDDNSLNKTSSVVMSYDKPIEDITLNIFDCVDTTLSFRHRYDIIKNIKARHDNICIDCVPQYLINNEQDMFKFEQDFLQCGYEGAILKLADGKYKYGRATQKDALMFKLKRFEDSEAIIVSVNELFKNANELTTNELGYAKRASSASGLVPMSTLGSLTVRDINQPEWLFNIGTGFTAEQRKNLWKNQNLIGRKITYKYFAHGIKNVPLLPVFLNFRVD